MRLIDADALKERAIRVSTVKENCYFKAVGTREIDRAPAVDAVEVVRCKDCKYYEKDTLSCANILYNSGYQVPNWYADDFCSYGERRSHD